MLKPRKHSEVIKAWADGAIIQWRQHSNEPFMEIGQKSTPGFYEAHEYRVKPDPKPDVVGYTRLHYSGNAKNNPYQYDEPSFKRQDWHNVRATFDGETGNLKSLEVL